MNGNSLSGSINLGGSVSATVSQLAIAINVTAGVGTNNLPSPAMNWAADVSLDGGATFGALVDPGANLSPAPSQSIAITAAAGGFALSGNLTALNVFNILTGSATFVLTESKVSVVQGTTTLTGATLLTLGLSNLAASAGAGGFGVSVSGGDLGLAYIEAPKPATGTDTRYWIAVTGANLAASLSLGANISAMISSISAQINQAGGTYTSGASGAAAVPAVPLNWQTQVSGTTVPIDPGTLFSPPPSTPVANAATFSVLGSKAGGLVVPSPGLLLGDSHLSGGTLSVAVVTQPTHAASLVVGNDGSFTYIPNTGYTGTDSFQYQIKLTTASGLVLTSNAATVTIHVDAAASAPNGNPANFDTNENSDLVVAAPGVLANATTTSGSAPTAVGLTNPSNGTLTLNSDGSFDYTPAANFVGNDSFTYKVIDGGNNVVETVSIVVNPAASMPIEYSGKMLALSGTLTNLNIYNLVQGTASFAISQSTVNATVPGGELTDASLLTVGLSNLQGSAGGGGYGLAVTSGNIGIAVLQPSDAQSPSSNRADWLAVDATNLAAMLNLGTNLSATVDSLTLEINQASGSYRVNGITTAAAPLGWATSLDLNGDGTFGGYGDTVNPGANLPTPVAMPIAFPAASLLQFSGSLTSLNIANGLITGSADFGLSVTQVSVVQNSTTTPGTLYMVALSNIQAGGFGVTFTGGPLGVAVIQPATSAHSSVTDWFAAVGTNLSTTINLGSVVSASVTGITFTINDVDGTGSATQLEQQRQGRRQYPERRSRDRAADVSVARDHPQRLGKSRVALGEFQRDRADQHRQRDHRVGDDLGHLGHQDVDHPERDGCEVLPGLRHQPDG